jgi:hypothetical protein
MGFLFLSQTLRKRIPILLDNSHNTHTLKFNSERINFDLLNLVKKKQY